jgi:hypothetical protein
MRQIKGIILATMALYVVVFIVGCSSSDQSGAGVVKIDKSQEEADSAQVAKASTQSVDSVKEGPTEPKESTVESGTTTPKLTDEEITTNFAACLREHGFTVPDPELNRDGTVNLSAMRESLIQNPKFNRQNAEIRQVMRDCLPLLQEATFVQERSSEDEIELQDNLLEFAQCLRDNGIKVPDPDFSNGVRASMGSLFQGINMNSANSQEGLAECRELHFSGMQGRPRSR